MLLITAPAQGTAVSYNVASILCWSLGDWSCPFFHNGEQVGGGNSLRAVGAGLLFPVSAQLSGGGGLGDGKVPKVLQVTWAVCRDHLCPGDAESVPLTPLPFSPWGLESPFPTKLVPPLPEFWLPQGHQPLCGSVFVHPQPGCPRLCHQNQAAGRSWDMTPPNSVLGTG